MSDPVKIVELPDGGKRPAEKKPASAGRFSGHVISVEPSDSKTIPEGERLFLSHLEDCFRKEPEPALSEHEVGWQYVTTDVLFNTKQVEAVTLNNSLVQSVLGLGVPGLALTSVFSFFDSKAAREEAERALDAQMNSQATNKEKMAISELFAGISSVMEKPLAIQAAVRGTNTGIGASTAAGQAAFATNLLGSASYFFLFFFFGASFWQSLQTVWDVEEEINKPGVDKIATLQNMINPSPEDTLKALKEAFTKEGSQGDYLSWLKQRLETEAITVTKDFLRAMNTNPETVHTFDEAAKKLLDKLDKHVQHNGSQAITDLGLTSAELIGLESLHVNRIAAAQKKVEAAIGSTAYQALLRFGTEPTDEAKTKLLALIDQGILHAKISNIAGFVMGMLASSVMAAGMITACIACPPFGLIVASTVFTLAAISFLTYVDLKKLLSGWNNPPGTGDERMNYGRLLFAIGGIAAVCAVSGASLGTVPVAVSLVAVSSVAVTSAFRAYDLRRKKAEEERSKISAADLKNRCVDLTNEKNVEELKRIVLRKLERSNLLTKTEKKVQKQHLYALITNKQVKELRDAIDLWQQSEEEALRQLQGFMKELTTSVEGISGRSWEEYIKGFFYGTPSVGKAF